MGLRIGVLVFGGLALALAACGDGNSSDTFASDSYTSASSDTWCGDAPGACCGAGDACCAGDCCGAGGFAPCQLECTIDEDCGADLVCDGGVCTIPPVDALLDCEQSPALADATFGAGTNDRPGALAVIDFSGDGIDDLLIGRSSGVAVWESRGDATFAEVGVFNPQIGGTPIDMIALDVDGDAAQDIVVLGEGSPGRIGLLRADETEVFAAQPVVNAGAAPTRLAAADLNGDTLVDLVLMSEDIPDLNVVHVLLADGAGGFLVPMDVTLPQPPLDVDVAELTGDGIPDLAIATPNGVSVLAGRGTGGFDARLDLTTPNTASQAGIAIADLDGNGSVEIVHAAEIGGAGRLSIWAWTGDATMPTPESSYALAVGLTHVEIVDIDLDGVPDIIATTGGPAGSDALPGEVLVMPVDPDRTVRCQAVYGIARPAVSMVSADLDGDGAPDIATASGEDTITLLLSGS